MTVEVETGDREEGLRQVAELKRELAEGGPAPAKTRGEAQRVYLESVQQGRPLSGVQLGERFGRSDRWGRDVIKEVKEAHEAVAAEAAGVRPLSADPVPSVARALQERQQRNGHSARPPQPSGPPEVGPQPPRRPPEVAGGNGSRPAAAAGNGSAGTAAGHGNGTAVRQRPETEAARRTPGAEPQRQRQRQRQPETAVPERQTEATAEPDDTTDLQLPGARFYARTGFMFGTLVSVGANVLQAWLPVVVKPLPAWIAARPEGWSPSLFQQVFAGVWPLALIFAIEVLSRVKWKTGWQWNLARYGGATSVAIFAAVISYGHLYQVLKAFDYGVGAYVGPLVLDGVMVVCGFALLSMTPERKRKRKE